MAETEVGRVFSYFSHIEVAAVNLSGKLKIGDKIRIKGNTTNFEQKVESMQTEGDSIKEAGKGSEVGIKVKEKVRPNDAVLKIA